MDYLWNYIRIKPYSTTQEKRIFAVQKQKELNYMVTFCSPIHHHRCFQPLFYVVFMFPRSFVIQDFSNETNNFLHPLSSNFKSYIVDEHFTRFYVIFANLLLLQITFSSKRIIEIGSSNSSQHFQNKKNLIYHRSR